MSALRLSNEQYDAIQARIEQVLRQELTAPLRTLVAREEPHGTSPNQVKEALRRLRSAGKTKLVGAGRAIAWTLLPEGGEASATEVPPAEAPAAESKRKRRHRKRGKAQEPSEHDSDAADAMLEQMGAVPRELVERMVLLVVEVGDRRLARAAFDAAIRRLDRVK